MSIGRPISLTPNIATKSLSSTATADQTSFTVTGGYRINELGVYRNGVRLVQGKDFTASDGSTVTLLSAATVGDIIDFVIFDSFNIADAINSVGDQTISGDLTATSFVGDGSGLTGIAVTGHIDAADLTVSGIATFKGVGNFDAEVTAAGGVDVTGGVKSAGIVSFTNTTASTSTTTGALIVSGGVGIAGSLHVGENVSVGGTLTYEDVTNIDSVGIVTAQLGVIATAGRGVQVTAGGLNVDAGIGTFDAGLKVAGGEITVGAAFSVGQAGVVTTAQLNVTNTSTFNDDVEFVGTTNGITSAFWDNSTNTLLFKDESYAKFGDGSDLSIYHQNGSSLIANTTGQLLIRSSTGLQLGAPSGEVYLAATENGAASLYYDNSAKLATSPTGVVVTGMTTSTTGIHAGPGILRENFRGYGSAMNGAYNADVLSTGMVLNAPTNSTATFTINLRGNGSTTFNSLFNAGESAVFTAFVGQNNSSYYLTDFQIDGASITEEWAGGTAPSAGGASGTDIYTFTILKTANATFSVFANVTNFA